MALIGRLIGKLLKRGAITIIGPDGKRISFTVLVIPALGDFVEGGLPPSCAS